LPGHPGAARVSGRWTIGPIVDFCMSAATLRAFPARSRHNVQLIAKRHRDVGDAMRCWKERDDVEDLVVI
jgi:hypothetical protein